MNSLGIIKMYNDLDNEEGVLKYKLSQTKKLKDKLEHICEHEVLVKWLVGLNKASTLVAEYYCPACGMKKNMCYSRENEIFFKSQIIYLTNINLIDDLETLHQIREEIINNYDFYYDENISEKEKAFKLYDKIKDYEYFEDIGLKLEKRNRE